MSGDPSMRLDRLLANLGYGTRGGRCRVWWTPAR